MTLAASLIVAGASSGLSHAAQTPDAKAGPDAAVAAQGQVIFKRYCAACHGAGGAGDGVLAKELRQTPTNLTQLAAKNGGVFPFDKVVRSVDGRDKVRVHGEPDMPVWGEVFTKTRGTDAPDVESALNRIAHYLWSVQKAGR
jgi:mono/diheme cytochrome c family protein